MGYMGGVSLSMTHVEALQDTWMGQGKALPIWGGEAHYRIHGCDQAECYTLEGERQTIGRMGGTRQGEVPYSTYGLTLTHQGGNFPARHIDEDGST